LNSSSPPNEESAAAPFPEEIPGKPNESIVIPDQDEETSIVSIVQHLHLKLNRLKKHDSIRLSAWAWV